MKRSRSFPETKSSVPQARRFIADFLAARAPDVAETATLLVSELATNALVHASSEFDVTVVYPTRAGRVRIEVADRNRSQPVPLEPPPTVPHGRGLFLVSTLADAWGVQEAGRRSGKTIWFELAPTPAGAAATEGSTARSASTQAATRTRRSRLGRGSRGGSSLSFGRPTWATWATWANWAVTATTPAV
jgi:anti-sigma regulatory factor (Ser/Thr protein kinase)